jgi:pimeloyl-ACP methyl ester carboxylesterase
LHRLDGQSLGEPGPRHQLASALSVAAPTIDVLISVSGETNPVRCDVDMKTLDVFRTTVATAAGDLSCLDVGEGAPTLFVHGLGTNAYLWRNVIPALAPQRRCIALDLPLHGHSPADPDRDLSLRGLADALVAFVDVVVERFGTGPLDVVGHDTGGALAQMLAVHRPFWLSSLTLTNCEVHDNVPPLAFQPTVDLARAGALAPTAPAMLADLELARTAVFAAGYEQPERLGTDMVRAFLEPLIGTVERARQFERLLMSLDARDLLAVEPQLERLDIPTLIVWATNDVFFDLRWAYRLRDMIPSVTNVVEVEGAKLFFPDERAGELVVALCEHWERVAAASISAPASTARAR